MGDPYIGEIRMFGGNFAPQGWAFCQGQLMAIADNEVLYQLIGTTYGGDGQETFQLPDLRSRVPVHVGPGYSLAQTGGVESVTLTTSQIPGHTHGLSATNAPESSSSPVGAIPARLDSGVAYAATAPDTTMQTTSSTGGGQPHDNMQPYLVLNFIISLFGVFPTSS